MRAKSANAKGPLDVGFGVAADVMTFQNVELSEFFEGDRREGSDRKIGDFLACCRG